MQTEFAEDYKVRSAQMAAQSVKREARSILAEGRAAEAERRAVASEEAVAAERDAKRVRDAEDRAEKKIRAAKADDQVKLLQHSVLSWNMQTLHTRVDHVFLFACWCGLDGHSVLPRVGSNNSPNFCKGCSFRLLQSQAFLRYSSTRTERQLLSENIFAQGGCRCCVVVVCVFSPLTA